MSCPSDAVGKIEHLADGGNYQGNVVAEFAFAEFRHFFHHAALSLRRGTAARPGHLCDPLAPKLDSLVVFGFCAAVGEKEQAITGNQLFR